MKPEENPPHREMEKINKNNKEISKKQANTQTRKTRKTRKTSKQTSKHVGKFQWRKKKKPKLLQFFSFAFVRYRES